MYKKFDGILQCIKILTVSQLQINVIEFKYTCFIPVSEQKIGLDITIYGMLQSPTEVYIAEKHKHNLHKWKTIVYVP